MGRAFEYRKARKMKRWSQMSKAFTKIGKEIAMAVKEAGPNPEANSRLRMAIQNAKSENMPKETVERAIKKAASKDQEDYIEMIYEGYAPHGIAVVVECLSNNNKRTVGNIRSYFTRSGGSLGTSGSLDFMFERKCYFKVTPPQDQDIEELELELIDYGVDEIFEDEENLMLYGGFTEFGAIQSAIEERGIEIISSGLERIPMDTKSLSPEAEEEVEKLLEKFEDDEDVQNVFHNMA